MTAAISSRAFENLRHLYPLFNLKVVEAPETTIHLLDTFRAKVNSRYRGFVSFQRKEKEKLSPPLTPPSGRGTKHSPLKSRTFNTKHDLDTLLELVIPRLFSRSNLTYRDCFSPFAITFSNPRQPSQKNPSTIQKPLTRGR